MKIKFMMISCLLGIFRVYLSSEDEDLRKKNKELIMLLDRDEGLIIFVDNDDGEMKEKVQFELESVIFHSFKYKHDDKKNCIKDLFEFSRSKDNFIQKVHENYNYKKLQHQSGFKEIGIFLLIGYRQDYNIAFRVKKEEGGKSLGIEQWGILVVPAKKKLKLDRVNEEIFVESVLNFINEMSKNPSQITKGDESYNSLDPESDKRNNSLGSNIQSKGKIQNKNENFELKGKIVMVVILLISFSFGLIYYLRQRNKTKKIKRRKGKNRN